jgi:hypothetical protein
VAAASGQFIKLLPGDDTLYSACLERQVAILTDSKYHDVVLVYCARDIIDSSGKKVMRARFPGNGVVNGSQLVRRTARYGTNVIGEPGAVLFRRDAARLIGGFDASLGYVIDLDYWVRLLGSGKAYAIRDPLCTFRISGENWSAELGHERCNQFLRFLERLCRDHGVSKVDQSIGRLMARVNERLRRVVYRRLLGVRTDRAGRIRNAQ